MDDAGIDLAVVLLEEDEFITKEAQPAIKAALSGKLNVEMYIYPGCNHAFARHTGMHYNAAAAAGEWAHVGLSFGPSKMTAPRLPNYNRQKFRISIFRTPGIRRGRDDRSQ
jgi:hypothetical protein